MQQRKCQQAFAGKAPSNFMDDHHRQYEDQACQRLLRTFQIVKQGVLGGLADGWAFGARDGSAHFAVSAFSTPLVSCGGITLRVIFTARWFLNCPTCPTNLARPSISTDTFPPVGLSVTITSPT